MAHTHTLPFHQCAGSVLIDSPTDSIFLPFSLIRLIIYKCCFKMVVFVAVHYHLNINVCLVGSHASVFVHATLNRVTVLCVSLRFQNSKLSMCTLKLYRRPHLKWIWVQRNGKPMVKMLRRPILNLVRMSAWTKIMAFRFGNNSARTFFFTCISYWMWVM